MNRIRSLAASTAITMCLVLAACGGGDGGDEVTAGSDVLPGGKTAAAPEAPGEPAPFGRFLETQVVKGAVLSCKRTLLEPPLTRCSDPLLNGIEIADNVREVKDVICAAVTGKDASFAVFGRPVAAPPFYGWSGSNWFPAPSAQDVYVSIECRV